MANVRILPRFQLLFENIHLRSTLRSHGARRGVADQADALGVRVGFCAVSVGEDSGPVKLSVGFDVNIPLFDEPLTLNLLFNDGKLGLCLLLLRALLFDEQDGVLLGVRNFESFTVHCAHPLHGLPRAQVVHLAVAVRLDLLARVKVCSDVRVGVEAGCGGLCCALVRSFAFYSDALDALHLRDAKRFNISIVVADVGHDVRDDLKPHAVEVAGEKLAHARGEGSAVLVQLLQRERGDDGALVACDGKLDELLDLLVGLSEEVLRGEEHGGFVEVCSGEFARGLGTGRAGLVVRGPAFDLDLADALDVDADSGDGEGVGRSDHDGV